MMRVKAGIFSLTPPAPADDDGSYLRWHLLDHMPEQYRLPGLVLGQRWIADGDYADHRIAADGPLANTGNVVNYLVGDPVQQTCDEFMQLGVHLAKQGRYPERRPSLLLRVLALRDWKASPRVLVSDDVVPFRPHRGVFVVLEQPTNGRTDAWLEWLRHEHYPELVDVPGTAGAFTYGSTDGWTLPRTEAGAPMYATVVYLDADPLVTTKALTPVIERRWASGDVRPLLAGPFRTMVQWDAWT